MKQSFYFFLLILFSIPSTAADLKTEQVYPLDYVHPNSSKTFYVTVFNTGTSTVANIPYSNVMVYWQFNNGSIQSAVPQQPQGQSSIIIFNRLNELTNPGFVIQTPAQKGSYLLKLWVKTATDNNPLNDTVYQTVKVREGLPQKNVVVEVFKHQSCGPCYPADTFLKGNIDVLPYYSVSNNYTVANEPCYSQDADAIETAYMSGNIAHPMAMIDRFVFPYEKNITASFFTFNGMYSLRNIFRREEYLQPVSIDFANVHVNTSTREITADLNISFFDTLNNDFRINLLIQEDSILGHQASAPNSSSYYHTRVLRTHLGGVFGIKGGIPNTVYPGQSVNYTFKYTVPTNYILKNLRLLAIIQDHNPNNAKACPILNSNKVFIKDHLNSTHVRNINKEVSFSIMPNPAVNYIEIKTNGSIEQITIADMNGKTIRTVSEKKIDIRDLPSGMYYISVMKKGSMTMKPFFKQ